MELTQFDALEIKTMNTEKQRSGHNYSLIAIVTIVVMVCGLLIWHASIRRADFLAHQQQLMQQSVHGVVNELATLIRDMKKAVAVFAQDNVEQIRYLAKQPEDQDARDSLEEQVAQHFSDFFAVTIADEQGVPLLDNFDLHVNEVCEQDIRKFIQQGNHYEVYIHPHTETYHFDIMARWGSPGDSGGVIFISFQPRVLTRLLGNAHIHGHELMLLNRDVPGLIEVTARGVRIELIERQGEFILSQEEMSRIGYTKEVPGTRWQLVDFPDQQIFNYQIAKIYGQTFLTMVVFLLVSVIMAWFAKREEQRRLQSEIVLQRTKSQLQHALEFSAVGTWELELDKSRFTWSDQALALFGHRPPIDLQAYLEMTHPDDRERLETAIRDCIQSSTPCRMEHRFTRADNSVGWLEINGNLDQESRNNKGKLLGLITDISERKQMEAARLAMEKQQQETLIREVRHRIKNNLQGVVGLMRQHATRHPENEELVDCAVSQLNSVSVVYGLQCNDDSGQIWMAELLNAICQSVGNLTGKTVHLEMQHLCNRPVMIMDDRAVAIALILNELLFNAIKHSEADEAEAVQVQATCSNGQACVSVRNRGTPLPLGFDLAKGTGLGTGLVLVKSLLPREGSSLQIREIPGWTEVVLCISPPVMIEQRNSEPVCATG